MQDLATGINEDHFDAGDVTEERTENSMAKFKDYFDGKFDNLAKVMELDELSVFNNNVDDNYFLVASHVDETTKQKITVMNILTSHDFCIKIGQEVMKITGEWLCSIADKNSINGYHKWNLASHVFLDIYIEYYPERTSELIQYSHIIQAAALSYS